MSEKISRHPKQNLWLPDYEQRAFQPEWFDRLYKILPLNTKTLLKHAGKRRRIVQAGSHLGIWPEYFSHHFKNVITFEPNNTLYECVIRNTAHRVNILCINNALGNCEKDITLYRHTEKTGVDKCFEVDSPDYLPQLTRQITVDSLCITDVDAIQFDIEQYEVHALEGARKTIERYHPAIQVEMHPAVRKAIEMWLTEAGYEKIGAASKDEVWVYANP